MGDINETLDSIHLCIQHSLLPSLLPLSLTSITLSLPIQKVEGGWWGRIRHSLPRKLVSLRTRPLSINAEYVSRSCTKPGRITVKVCV